MNIINFINNTTKIAKAVNQEFFKSDFKPKTDIPQHFGGGKFKSLKKKRSLKKIKKNIYSKRGTKRSLKKIN